MSNAFHNPSADMSSTEKRLLTAARRILSADGIHALTTRAVTTRAGENLAAVHYHFGSKEGLIKALISSHTYDASTALLDQARDLPPGKQRTDAWIDGMREIAEDDESFTAFFELFPLALRHPDLRDRLGELYDWYRQSHVDVLTADVRREDAQALAVLIVATIDGLAIQRSLHPGLDITGVFDLLKSLIQNSEHLP